MDSDTSRQITGSEQFFWAEVFSKGSNRRSVALAYALVVIEHRSANTEFWDLIDRAVIRKFRIKTERDLASFQRKASMIVAAAARQKTPLQQPSGKKTDVAV